LCRRSGNTIIRAVMARVALACVALLASLSVPGGAQEQLDATDRNFLVDYLVRTQRMYRDEVKGLSSEQWRFKPLPHRWSVAECAEHIILTERWLLSEFREKFARTPEPAYIFHWRKPKPLPGDFSPAPRSIRKNIYRERIAQETDRSRVDPNRPPEGDPPEPSLAPRSRFASPEDAVADLYENYVYPGAGTRLLDGYEYLLRLPAHSERHVAQMREVKGHPDFPVQK
jgi:hypothetical protein